LEWKPLRQRVKDQIVREAEKRAQSREKSVREITAFLKGKITV